MQGCVTSDFICTLTATDKNPHKLHRPFSGLWAIHVYIISWSQDHLPPAVQKSAFQTVLAKETIVSEISKFVLIPSTSAW